MQDGGISGATLLWVAVFTVVPILLITATSYLKISVVFSILGNALGSSQIPGGPVVVSLATILSLYVMAPVGREMLARAPGALARIDSARPLVDLNALIEAVSDVAVPLGAFLERNAGARERQTFVELANRPREDGHANTLDEHDFLVLLPAFVVSELNEAFLIGLLVFLPFLIVDLVVSNVLTAVGLNQLSPTQVSAPFKLLLFVLVDGWMLLSRALVEGYL
jgi:type III secretion protein R